MMNISPRSDRFSLVIFRYLSVLLLIIPILLSGEVLNQRMRNHLMITTESQEDLRRIEVNISGINDNEVIIHPELTVSPLAGIFEVTYSPIDSSNFIENYTLLDRGAFPLKLSISFPDSITLKLRGETISYRELKHYYQFDSGNYVLDLFVESSEKPITSADSSRAIAQAGVDLGSTSPEVSSTPLSSKSNGMLLRAIIYSALLAVSLIGLIVFYGLVFKKPFDMNTNSAGVESPSASKWKKIFLISFKDIRAIYTLMQNIFKPHSANPSRISIPNLLPGANALREKDLTPELLDEHIQNLVETMNVSYDEALLRVSMQIKGSAQS